jgi:hypothetical protein
MECFSVLRRVGLENYTETFETWPAKRGLKVLEEGISPKEFRNGLPLARSDGVAKKV